MRTQTAWEQCVGRKFDGDPKGASLPTSLLGVALAGINSYTLGSCFVALLEGQGGLTGQAPYAYRKLHLRYGQNHILCVTGV